MKTIIAGSRSILDINVVERAVVESGFTITEVVSGHAYGVDRLGEIWAHRHGIPIKVFPAKWGVYGRSAGYLRNEEMAKYADALVAVWDGGSRGTKHMIALANEYKLKVYVVRASRQG